MYRISRAASGRYTANRAKRWAQPFTKRQLLQAARALWPMLATLAVASVAHAQGTMDFSGAQTLMGTFKTFTAFVRRADEGTLSRLVVEASILLAASRGNPTVILKEAAATYKVDTDAITTKVRQEFAAKEKAKKATQPAVKNATKAA
jgi:hypothetical protein